MYFNIICTWLQCTTLYCLQHDSRIALYGILYGILFWFSFVQLAHGISIFKYIVLTILGHLEGHAFNLSFSLSDASVHLLHSTCCTMRLQWQRMRIICLQGGQSLRWQASRQGWLHPSNLGFSQTASHFKQFLPAWNPKKLTCTQW